MKFMLCNTSFGLGVPHTYRLVFRTTCYKGRLEFVFAPRDSCHPLTVRRDLPSELRGFLIHIEKVNAISCTKCIYSINATVANSTAIPVWRRRQCALYYVRHVGIGSREGTGFEQLSDGAWSGNES